MVTTEDHHFWNETDREWEETRDIEFGDTLLSTEGSSVTVVGLDWNATSYGPAFDLTVDETHTYYVTVGDDDTPVLVHNCNGDDNCNCTGAFDIAAYDLADRLTVFHSHPTNDLQRFGGDGVGHNGVTNLSNDDLVRFGGPSGDDPIAGNITFGPDDYPGPASELNITAGNHRIEEIVRRVNNGSMSESTRIRILRSRSGGAI